MLRRSLKVNLFFKSRILSAGSLFFSKIWVLVHYRTVLYRTILRVQNIILAWSYRTTSCQKLTLTHFLGSWPWNIPPSGHFKELLNVSMLLHQLDCEVFKKDVIIERFSFPFLNEYISYCLFKIINFWAGKSYLYNCILILMKND